ncbi:sulfate adenylyltransferase subunit CysN [Pseudomonas sp. NY15364]|uniref:sulfate adenylyltransferase subunit CysN n=1 Tax=Pseudomonas sp. NY15364 TaxID=3400353 RepID=UPI003A84E589
MSHQSDLIASDIEAYLHQHENKDLLRFLTCGNVDDGKSTLIGRLLFDTNLIYEDHLAALHKDNERVGNAGEALDLALLVDGLQSEREQGITIDVAYRYFSTEKRKFIIADCPGHEQYTRNMATGASTCDLAIILIDARRGVQTQTRRHSFIASLLGIKHIVVAINKMDLMDFSREVFDNIRAEYQQLADKLGLHNVHFVPVSALNGDNVVKRSERSPWYEGQTLMEILESVELSRDQNFTDLRLPIQFVNRPNLDFRGFCGTLASGVLRQGDTVMALPSGKTSKVKSIITYEGELQEAYPGNAITVTLEDEIDISRGDELVHPEHQPNVGSHFSAHVVWMGEKPLVTGKEYGIKLGTKSTFGCVTAIQHEIDVNSLEKKEGSSSLDLNSIALIDVELTEECAFDSYSELPRTGAFAIIDRLSNVTVGAGMVLKSKDHADATAFRRTYNLAEVELNAFIRKNYPEWECIDISQTQANVEKNKKG